jgi:hypothetical protein
MKAGQWTFHLGGTYSEGGLYASLCSSEAICQEVGLEVTEWLKQEASKPLNLRCLEEGFLSIRESSRK